LEKSGNKLVRVIFDNPANQEGPGKWYLEKLIETACSYEGANQKYICIDIPKDVDLFKVCNYVTDNNIQWEHAAPSYEELYLDEN